MNYEDPPPSYDSLQLSVQNYIGIQPLTDSQQIQNCSDPPPTSIAAPIQINPTASPTVSITNFGAYPQITVCPSCQVQVISDVLIQPTTNAHLCCLILTCLLCWPCAIMPYAMDSCQKHNHFCPHCRRYLGTRQT